MFVQVIQGQVSDREGLKAALERWLRDVAPGASGWLGSTGGVTADGTFIALARFESEEAARRNGDRPEQSEWWADTARHLSGVTFHDSSDVEVDKAGDPNEAGFVQVMKGRTTDPGRAREIMAQDSDAWAAFRPEVIGSLTAQYDDKTWTMALYFTSEEAARHGESKKPPPELLAQMVELEALSEGTPEFYDLREPWLYSPA